jgi:LuxR family maltose regulon positive regulatory protein
MKRSRQASCCIIPVTIGGCKMTLRFHLLTTKIQAPPLPPQTVQRTRLLDALDRGLQPHIRMSLLSAPAGYGKTTLMSAWVQDRGFPCAWFSLDESDNDPIHFFTYLLAALETGNPSLDVPSFGEMQVSEPTLHDRILIPLINLLGQSAQQTIIVLDDYHWIQSQAVHDRIAYLLENLPPQAHIMIATRADPPLPVARLRGRGQVNELRMKDLQFQVEEAKAFLETFAGLGLNLDDIHTLTHRTEGWISGLQMAAVSLQGHEDEAAFVQEFSGSHQYIMDYLVDEVLRRQTPEVQTFLLDTSILNRLSGPLCDAVTKDTSGVSQPSQRILKDLQRSNLFIVPLDQKGEWYRYHRLFSDLLQARLQRKGQAHISKLQRRASEWYETEGLIDEAIQHALRSQDHGFAADLIERNSQDALMRSETMTFLRWVQMLPEEEIQSRTKLGVYRAWTLLLHGAPLTAVELQLHRSRKESDPPGSSLALEAFIALSQGRIDRGMELTEKALDVLPDEEVYLRDIATLCAAAARIWLGDIERGYSMLEQTSHASQRSGNIAGAVMVLCELAELHSKQLQLDKAQELYDRALALTTDQDGNRLPIAGEALCGLGYIALQRYDLDSAEQLLQNGLQLLERWSPISALNAHLSMAMLYEARQDTERILDSLEILHDLARRFDTSELDDLIVDLFEAGIKARQGDIEAVREWVVSRGMEQAPARKTSSNTQDPLLLRIYKYELPPLARFHLGEARYRAALDIIEELATLAVEPSRPNLQIEAEILRARTLLAMGDESSAQMALRRALEIAEPEDVRLPFLIEGEAITQLLEAIRSNLDSPQLTTFVERLLQQAKPIATESPQRSHGLHEPLSPREIEVLRLLPTGLTAEEIASRLIISVNTVRSHMKSIYAKLGVHSRHEAVIRASEDDLL